jgi:hypothetical protein
VDAMLQAALEVLLDQAGGEVSYDQAEYLAIKGRRGPYRTEGHVDLGSEAPEGRRPLGPRHQRGQRSGHVTPAGGAAKRGGGRLRRRGGAFVCLADEP